MISISKGTNNESLSNINRALVIQYLKAHEVCSRAQVSKALGLTGASISKIVSTMIEAGIVREVGYMDGEKGRRSIGIALNVDTYKVIGVKLSRRSFSVGVFDLGGTLYDAATETIRSEMSLQQVVERIRPMVEYYLQQYQDIMCVGMAVPGPFDKLKGEILFTTETRGWVNVPLVTYLRDAFSVPIFFAHDANAGALAEWWLQIAQKHSCKTLAHLLVGEGVGAGVVHNGNVFTGAHGIAGEIGHVSIDVNGERCFCGNYGCLESFCSSIAFVKSVEKKLAQGAVSMLSQLKQVTAEDVFEAARLEDAFAMAQLREAGQYIGYGIVNLVNAYDPQLVILSDIMTGGGPLMLASIRQTVHERLIDGLYEGVTIQYSGYKSDLILYGAATIAMDHFLKEPMRFLQAKQEKQFSNAENPGSV